MAASTDSPHAQSWIEFEVLKYSLTACLGVALFLVALFGYIDGSLIIWLAIPLATFGGCIIAGVALAIFATYFMEAEKAFVDPDVQMYEEDSAPRKVRGIARRAGIEMYLDHEEQELVGEYSEPANEAEGIDPQLAYQVQSETLSGL